MQKRGRGYYDSPSKNFCHSTETIRRGTLLFQKIWYRKMLRIREGGGYHNFPSKLFCLTAPKHFVEETLCAVFQKISGSEKVYGQEGGGRGGGREYQHFSSKFSVSVPKTFVGEPFQVSEFWYRNFSCIRGGGVSRFSVIIIKLKM